jgi:two-component system, chemotaxis family, CheB/CheR fusion protein
VTPSTKPGTASRRPRERARAARTVKRGTDPAISEQTDIRHPIVGIGASAGGLEAFTALLQHLPLDTGMGFVLVQHLDPQHESALAQLLTRATSMPVREVTNNLRVEANCVYVIPPNTNLTIAQGILKLEPRQETRGALRSIDFFFESLAQDQRQGAIGVILSGTATDGTLGLEAIKAEGGITFAQDESARYDSMPRSAIAAGCVDFVLTPEDVARELARIAKHPFVAGQLGQTLTASEDDWAFATEHEGDETELSSGGDRALRTGVKRARVEGEAAPRREPENGFKKILLLLRNHCGVDFSLYKSTTIRRRIARRMVLNKLDTPEAYARFLRGNVKELDALFSDALISVTSFFRNPEAFDILKRRVFPRLLRRGDGAFRVWVLGCSTGQEAYSIAMAFLEAAEEAPRMRKLQVFATDLNEAVLDKARQGLYAKSLVQDVSPERLRRFFVEEEGGYRIGKTLREAVVFARQDIVTDPPFSRMDLVSCRNLLIYLHANLQKKVLPTFHYALKPEGCLFLGASESIGGFTDLFEPVDRKHKIYTKKAALTPTLRLPLRKESGEKQSFAQRPNGETPRSAKKWQSARKRLGEPEGFRAELNSQREADRVTLNQYAPPGVLVNADLQILQFRGPTGAYLEPPTGKASFDVLKMAREGLMLPLRAAINLAKKENKTARKEDVRVKQNGETRTVDVEVVPLRNLKERCFLILFDEAGKGRRGVPGASFRGQPSGAAKKLHPVSKREESRRVADSERELSDMRDYLQSVEEQHEAATEELQASNEEVQSANEELQSLNEELETSKEELESANEELTTVNEEMANRNTELNRLNSDLLNLQTSTHLVIVLLGRDLTLRRFSAQAEKQLNLLATDVGRPLSSVRHNLDLSDLEAFVGEVIATVREHEREVRDKDGRWYSLRVRPYLTVDNKVDGAVLVLVDIDELKRSEQAARERTRLLDLSNDATIVRDPQDRITYWSHGAETLYGWSREEAIGKVVHTLLQTEFPLPLEQIVAEFRQSDSWMGELIHTSRNGQRLVVLSRWAIDRDKQGDSARTLETNTDISERKRAEEALRVSDERYRTLVAQVKDYAIFMTDTVGRATSWNEGVKEILGFDEEEFIGQDIVPAIFTPEDVSAGVADRELQKAAAEGSVSEDRWLRRKDGTRFYALGITTALKNGSGTVIGFVKIFRNMTQHKQAEDALWQSHEQLRASEQRQRFLMNELAHRSTNLLTVIQSVVSLSMVGNRSLSEARDALTRRIQALAQSQMVLMTGGSTGAPVAEIVRLEFEAFSDRVVAVGPDVLLNSKAAQTFALLVHELATNASKHGALSRPDGEIAIRWSIEGAGTEARLKFSWKERGGPPVAAPSRRGFGRTLLENAVVHDFNAQPKMEFSPDGLSYEIDALLSTVAVGSADSSS